MIRWGLLILAVWALAPVPAARAEMLSVTGAFGGSVYQTKPSVGYPEGGSLSIPANYSLCLGLQTKELAHDLLAFISWDRFWSGEEVGFSNSSHVLAAGMGKSFTVGYSEIELLAGLCHYDETFKLNPTAAGQAEIEHSTVGGLLGAQLVFWFLERVDGVVSYRLLLRDEKEHSGELSDGGEFTVGTNSIDHVITFGFGYHFGG